MTAPSADLALLLHGAWLTLSLTLTATLIGLPLAAAVVGQIDIIRGLAGLSAEDKDKILGGHVFRLLGRGPAPGGLHEARRASPISPVVPIQG
jgi:hypothetical protein